MKAHSVTAPGHVLPRPLPDAGANAVALQHLRAPATALTLYVWTPSAMAVNCSTVYSYGVT